MNSEEIRIRGAVSPQILDKATRLFRNDCTGVWGEVLQNARRAGATEVRVQIDPAGDGCQITVEDNGHGIEDFQSLLTLGTSNWNADVIQTEDPAGMGFFSLCHSWVEVHSGNRFVKLTPATFLGHEEAVVLSVTEPVHGTRIRFTRASEELQLVAALKCVAYFAPITVIVNGRAIDRHDFLEGALHREEIDGIEIGIAHEFRWSHGYNNENWNFHGLSPDGLFARDPLDNLENKRLHIRFNVHRTGAVSLQLPDRHAIVEDESFRVFERKVRTAIYRFFAEQQHHILPYADWKEAQELGVVLPEAAPLLRTWRARAADDTCESIFGEPSRELAGNLSQAVLVSAGLENQHTLDGALATGASLDGDLFEEEPAFEGYGWYSSLPRVASARVRINGQDASKLEWGGKDRPQKIEIQVTIVQTGKTDRTVVLPALIHVDSECYGEPRFVAALQSPWDNPGASEPFSVVEFLMAATFVASDTAGEADSWETQYDEYRETVERIVLGYFLGPRASLLYLLTRAIPWAAEEYLEELGINEFRFRREPGRRHWIVDLGEFNLSGFETYAVADVNTGYLAESDQRLMLNPECPTRIAITDDGCGTFHVVTDDEEIFADEMKRAGEAGLSTRFRVIMERLRAAGIPYVRFDADGGEIDGLDRFDAT